MSRTILLWILLCFSFSKLSAQMLHIGDKLPNVSLSIHLGDSVYQKQLDDFKGKLVLFDFWNIGCTYCITAMPHLFQLQEEFKDKMQIILVAPNSRAEIEALWSKLKGHISDKPFNAFGRLPCIVSDTILHHLLHPTGGDPIHAFIDKNGLLLNVTEGAATDTKTIEDMLKGNVSNDFTAFTSNIDRENPLTWLDPLKNPNTHSMEYSIIMDYIPGKIKGQDTSEPVKEYSDSDAEKLIGMSFLNTSAIDLYQQVYGYWIRDRILLDVRDSSKFYMPSHLLGNVRETERWYNNNGWCYSIRVPESRSADIYDLMKQDLDRFFGVDSKIEHRRIKVYVLKPRVTPGIGINRFATKSTKRKMEQMVDESYKNGLKELMSAVSMEDIYAFATNYLDNLGNPTRPKFNEVRYKGKVDVELPVFSYGNSSFAIMRKALMKYGLDIVEEYRVMDVLVIRDEHHQRVKHIETE